MKKTFTIEVDNKFEECLANYAFVAFLSDFKLSIVKEAIEDLERNKINIFIGGSYYTKNNNYLFMITYHHNTNIYKFQNKDYSDFDNLLEELKKQNIVK